MFLNTFDVGQAGLVLDDRPYWLRYGQFIVKMDYELNDDVQRIVSPEHELFLIEPMGKVPGWMPPFSIDDVFIIHENMLRGYVDMKQIAGKKAITSAIYPIVSGCWRRRLPAKATDIWPMLMAHGFGKQHRTSFVEAFDFGFELLIRSNGRNPIKRKRMEPLAIGKYLPNSKPKNTVTS
jgi:hypothetical protein